jgi:hypothetical protein
MFNVISELNWLAILVASIVYFVLGAAWFTPLFGKAYDRALGTDRGKTKKWPAVYYYGPFLGSIVATTALAILMYAAKINNLSDALLLATIIGVGFSLSTSLVVAINPNIPKPVSFGLVTGLYHLVSLLVVVSILFWMK